MLAIFEDGVRTLFLTVRVLASIDQKASYTLSTDTNIKTQIAGNNKQFWTTESIKT